MTPLSPRFSSARRLLLAGLFTLAAGAVQAQGPSSVRILVGFPPGGGTDAIARTLAEKLKDQLGVPVVVDNRAGAGGQIAAQTLKSAAPDGSTFFLSHDHSISILPLVTKNAGFDPAVDFIPVAGFATFANALALSSGTPAKSLPEYVRFVQQQGGKDTIGVPAPASIPEFLVGMVGSKYKLDLQAAPYRGSAPMMADMLGNQIKAGVASIPDFIENHKAGKLRIVAVIGDKRQAILPDVPTFKELGIAGLEELPYYGLFAPAGTPHEVIDRMNQALAKVIAMPDVREHLTAMGLTVGYQPQSLFANRVKGYTQTWDRIIKASGFQAK
ncbi:Bug family tripartite tricarboxylate transporter substrate binding protein [Ramlibacter alkalitolerans]|uniref:Bug family tripartite tricarboxylate transporter substrate binding protein n=1 Tax=Ramlibacter alkalitolerans TaxID=2039631 RepID=A0ABS1JV52_9BURK|nr:Bug family tripartite tricarboxylate transporter substrate binding protein [Ramlibacter alkalitolerans]MBL0428031.1 Bug family tripartite tricarboxylate transporter substrate binding protein [Ramlibacter alkalitolerans]